MPVATRQVTRDDILPDAEFRLQRKDRRAALLPRKSLRRIALGPWCTFYFECFETMLFQIQEMLLIEKGGEAQIADELAAYNPLIPQGNELIATVMFEVDDPVRRARVLAGLGRVEHRFEIRIGAERVKGVPEDDAERSREDGKTSAVHFLRFAFTAEQAQAFRESPEPVILACDDPRYLHMAGIGPETRAELAADL
ncbi:DUF3501 family protein [Flavisphingomonas formosensis]|uniref:DUF3501 family protein n=1 Tax=Flavisphingomonas formosensis TaxID=861534 RepID=UPI0012FB1974|nr:DUF3501 family protein [Sphingomonas formosensis]